MNTEFFVKPLTDAQNKTVAAALQILEERVKYLVQIENPTEIKDYLRLRFATELREIFTVVYLDTKHRILGVEELFHGSIKSTTIHPREVVARAIAIGASSAILCHNHPSGSPAPSRADIELTERLKNALELIEVRVLDHIIVASAGTFSLAENGLI